LARQGVGPGRDRPTSRAAYRRDRVGVLEGEFSTQGAIEEAMQAGRDLPAGGGRGANASRSSASRLSSHLCRRSLPAVEREVAGLGGFDHLLVDQDPGAVARCVANQVTGPRIHRPPARPSPCDGSSRGTSLAQVGEDHAVDACAQVGDQVSQWSWASAAASTGSRPAARLRCLADADPVDSRHGREHPRSAAPCCRPCRGSRSAYSNPTPAPKAL